MLQKSLPGNIGMYKVCIPLFMLLFVPELRNEAHLKLLTINANGNLNEKSLHKNQLS